MKFLEVIFGCKKKQFLQFPSDGNSKFKTWKISKYKFFKSKNELENWFLWLQYLQVTSLHHRTKNVHG